MTKEQFKQLLKLSIESNDVSTVLTAARRVASSKNPQFICDFAEYVELADHPIIMEILEESMLAYGDPNHAYEMAFCMQFAGKKNFNLRKFEDFILASEDDKLIGYFKEGYVKGANLERMKVSSQPRLPKVLQGNALNGGVLVAQARFAAQKNSYALTSLANHFPNEIDSKAMHEQIFEIGDDLNTYEFGCSFANAGKRSVTRKVVEGGSAKLMWYIAEYTDWNYEQRLLEEIEKTGNKKYIDLARTTVARKIQERAAAQSGGGQGQGGKA